MKPCAGKATALRKAKVVGMEKLWLKNDDMMYEEADRIAQFCGVSSLVARMLINRGIADSFAVMDFLNPYYLPLPDRFNLAIDRIEEAVRKGAVIFIHGDYDVDGITSTAILHRTVTRLGGKAAYFIPDRVKDGYGLKEHGVNLAFESGADVLVTVDCGINAYYEVAKARSLGMDVVILDHHQPGQVAETPYIVSGELLPESSYHHHLSGAGLAFMFCVQLGRRFAAYIGEEILEQTIELATLGTLADVVPLFGANRWIVKTGLRKIKTSPSIALRAMMKAASMGREKVTSTNIPFALTPMVNAAGRLTDSSIPIALFLTEDAGEADMYAAKLGGLNGQRQQLQEEHLKVAIELAENRVTEAVVIHGSFPHGVAGLIASKLVEAFGHPAIVLSLSEDGKLLTGSARSVPGINIYEILLECVDTLERFGGHAMAAGMTLQARRFESFATLFDSIYQEKKSATVLVPPGAITVDAEVTHKDITFELVDGISKLEPFGAGNPKPVFLLKRVSLGKTREVGNDHLKCVVSADEKMHIAGIGFGLYGKFVGMQADAYDIVATPETNIWQDNITLQLAIKDIKQSKRGNLTPVDAFQN